jgi:hypothetical protein
MAVDPKNGQFVTDYTPELAERICAEIIDGKSLRTLCKMEGMPSKRSIMYWLNKHQEFRDLYDRACIERSEGYAEELVDIADDVSNDYISDGEGGFLVDREHIQRSRLRVDTRKWICAKMKPRKYGDKVETTHQVGDTLAALMAEIDGKSRALPG